MIWVDRAAKKFKESAGNMHQHVDDMKTPSGRVHVGALRGVLIHDIMHKALVDQGISSEYTYVFNDLDQMDAIPSYLDKEKWEQYSGVPLCNIPSPEKGFDNFAQFYAKEFIRAFETINCHPTVIWSSELYRSGKMNDVIKEGLDNAAIIREQYEKIAKAPKPDNWYPYQVICETCGKSGTTTVTEWDGKLVTYICEENKAKWTKGCGHSGKISPFDGNGKFLWKVDWAAHWKKLGVTIESSGKDHMSKGGSYDLSSGIVQHAFHYTPPHSLGGYEWFTIGGTKMSSSKGIGTSAREAAEELLPPELLRFLLVRAPIERAIDFNPYGETIPNLFDDYDRCMTAYFDKTEGKTLEGKQAEVQSDFARIYELSQIDKISPKRVYVPRFRTIMNIVRAHKDVQAYCEEQKGFKLTTEEQKVLNERVAYAKKHIEKYGDTNTENSQSSRTTLSLNENQKHFLNELVDQLSNKEDLSRDEIQEIVFSTIKKGNYVPKEVFKGFYQVLTGKDFGPKVADLILDKGIDNVIKIISSKHSEKEAAAMKQSDFPLFDKKNLFSIDSKLKESLPNLNVGIAIIKNVKVEKTNEKLQNEIDSFVKGLSDLSNETISSFPEITSYRKLYKSTGIDWHSRRPSPEALLRRIALKKGLYSINSCVDAYNLIVLKNRISVGAFDLNKIKFPTELRFAKDGEEILLIGDKEPTKYKAGEIAYFDAVGGYNIDFNYRDSQRTQVTTDTTNLFINVEGAYDISRTQVQNTLKETIDIVLKYCGGKVETYGITY